MSQRKSSMSMADLEAIHEEHTMKMAAPKVDPNIEIYQQICNQVQQDDLNNAAAPTTKKMVRRGSMAHDDDDMADASPATALPKKPRRHSSYESRMRREFAKAHSDTKEYISQYDSSPRAERRASFINTMMEFNLSLSISQDAQQSKTAMQVSCPVLSYMNDEEEDSVELRLMKRPSMTYVGDESSLENDGWEGLQEDNTTQESSMNESREYVIELPPLQDLAPKKRRRRKPHSYQILEQQLSETSPMEVLKNFHESFTSFPQVVVPPPATSAAAPAPAQPKSLEQDSDLRRALNLSTPQQQPMAASRPAMARGA